MKQPRDTQALQNRLSKVIGQLNGVKKMIDEDAHCTDVLIQINACKSALHRLAKVILEGHINHCMRTTKNSDIDKTLDELANAIEHFSRI